MYYCPECKKESTRYVRFSDNWIKGLNSRGERSDKCTVHDVLLVSEEKEVKIQTAAINTQGCSGASKPFTH